MFIRRSTAASTSRSAARAPHFDFSARHGGDDRPASRFDVVAPQLVRRGTESWHAIDLDGGCTAAGHADAEFLQERTEFDDVGFARGVTDFRSSVGSGGREQRRLGARDRRLVEIHRGGLESFRHFEPVPRTRKNPRAHGLERLEMRGNRTACRKVAARQRESGAAAPREQRTYQQHRTAQAADERRVGFVFGDLFASHPQRRRACAFDRRAEIDEQLHHRVHVFDARHVGERALLCRQQTRGQERQRGVLVAFDVDGPGQPRSAFNVESGHEWIPSA